MVVTVTVNPAIDSAILADRLAFEDRGYVLQRGESAGGRGLNASSVLHAFGMPTRAIVVSGGESGKRFEECLARQGFAYDVVPIAQNLRTNLIITDRQGLTIKLNEMGPSLTEQELAQLEETVRGRLAEARWLLLCGSLPPGAPPQFYNRLIQAAREHGVETLLDTDGEVLQFGLEEQPTMVTPNQQEAARLLNRALITRQHFRTAAQRILGMGAQSVMISVGSRGAIAGMGNQIVEIVPPRVEAVSPIGSGDALNAAFVWARVNGYDFVEAARWGVAAGTASAKLPGTRFANLEQTKEIYVQVEVR
ncbi:MAG: 1-phosphofructokinase family hexose kinase [Bryobacterales bacterium]|nr:1-phosphofructokinase family hexose kinase [Bryobacterales bacterium]